MQQTQFLQAKIGDNVTIFFRFRDSTIYFAGLDVRGQFPDLRYKKTWQQPLAASFIMKDKTRISSYWPSSGVKKADLTVEILKV